MRVGIPRESWPGEKRVAATPESVLALEKIGFSVTVEEGAGTGARIQTFNCAIGDPWKEDLILKVRPPTLDEVDRMKDGAALITVIQPAQNKELLERLAQKRITTIALDQIPRITRAQKMDVLSSQANLAGYRAIIEAVAAFGQPFDGQMTAAGKSKPAQVLVIGVGVAGLAAIGAARKLGAEVRAFDVRPSVKEQIQSMGAKFLEVSLQESGDGGGGYAKEMSPEFIAAEMALFMEQAKQVDIVVTTALIPGRKAPTLWTKEHVAAMKPGSVIVDMAAEQGGNVIGVIPGEIADINGVKIVGFTDLPSRMAPTASAFFANNIVHLLKDLGGAKFNLDFNDEVVRKSVVTHDGKITWPPPPDPPSAAPPAPTAPKAAPPPPVKTHGEASISPVVANVALGVAGALLVGIGMFAPTNFVQHLTVFALACFIGWQVVWKVTAALHTPLMSVTNAISGIILIGGTLQAATGRHDAAAILGAVAVLFASINVAGGFLVTHRMLGMFRKEGR